MQKIYAYFLVYGTFYVLFFNKLIILKKVLIFSLKCTIIVVGK